MFRSDWKKDGETWNGRSQGTRLWSRWNEGSKRRRPSDFARGGRPKEPRRKIEQNNRSRDRRFVGICSITAYV